MKNFKELKVWQKGIELVALVYTITTTFPEEEKYGLSAQMRRAAISIHCSWFLRRVGDTNIYLA